MDRIGRLTEAAGEIERSLFSAQCQRLELDFRGGKRREEAVKAFTQMFELAAEEAKETAWLGICYLNTSLVTRSHEVLLSLYDREFYLDAAPIERYWRPIGFGECLEEDMVTVMKELRNRFPRIWAYEETKVRRRCAEYYHAALCQFCRDLGEEVMGTEAFMRAQKAKRFAAYFGAYHGEGEILWHTGEL